MSGAAEAFAYRLDQPLPARLFGAELQITGWLVQRAGEPIHGIRARVKRPLQRAQVIKARRKRSRPDAEAAFPDLPGAKASGFFLELHFSLGRQRVELQVLDAARVWRTFHVAEVRALPLKSLARLGFPRVRAQVLGLLTRSWGESKHAPTGGASAALPAARAITQVDLFATSRSNLFILEIGELIAAGFRELGCSAQLRLDEPPEKNPPPDHLQIVVTPHEFFNLYLTEHFSREEARALCARAVLLGTEQPETRWFQSNLQWASSAESMADIHPLGVLAYAARRVRCHHLPLGYHPMLRGGELKALPERALEITFLGSLTERREKFFAAQAPFFSERRAHLRFVPLHFAKTAATRSYLSTDRRNALLADTQILLNVHYSEQHYFEWHRMLVGLANGCCIITEPCVGYGPLVPGEHFVMVEKENLIAASEFYLRHPDECARIARQGREFVESHLRQAQMCERFLRELETPGGVVTEDSAPQPAPPELRRKISQQRRSAFRQAAAADLRDLWCAPLLPNEQPIEETDPATKRTEAIAKRRGYGQRLAEQEAALAAGEEAWRLHDNDGWGSTQAPALSVIVTLFNYAEFIGDCLRSIERAAEMLETPLEILIVDDASTDDSLAQAMSYQARSALAVRVVAKRWNTGLADARNVGTRLARAPFVFMMDADNLVFPEVFRELLIAVATEDRAAAYSLLCRFRGTPTNRTGLLSIFDWDPQILVQQPYVDAMALFRREVLLELGGYDSRLTQIGWFGWEDYDLWLRFAARDLRVGFVPNIHCLYRQHEVSMLSVTNLFELDLVRHFHERFRVLRDRFEPQETLFGVDRRKLEPRKTSFFIASGCPIATTTLYRCEHLREQLHSLGHRARVVEWFDEEAIEIEEALTSDVLVLYRLPMSARLQVLLAQARERSIRIIFDTDDLVFEPELLSWHRAVAQLSPADQAQHRAGVDSYLETLLAADVVTTSTPLLAELAAKRGKLSFVHRNAVGQEMIALASQLGRRPVDGKVVIGYGSGTPTHDVDFEEVAGALAKILESYAKVELWLAGALTIPESLVPFEKRIRRFPLTDWRGWFELMSRMDIALAPLERENIFCRAKSEVKFIEAGSIGLPVVASKIDPYEAAIVDGANGRLASDEGEWVSALSQLIEKPELRRSLGDAARRSVQESYSPQVRAAELADLLHRTACDETIGGAATNALKLNWLVPEPFPGAGGDVGIFRVIRELAELGHDCQVYVVAYQLMNDFSTEQVREYVQKHFGETPARYFRWEGSVREADATFATFWPTAENVLALPNGGERYYLVQDFEPSFYPDDPPHYQRAEATYRAGFRCVTLGPWLAKLLRESYGAKADHFDFAVDPETYRPRPGLKSRQRRVCFYARPATPRRGYELGLEAFERLRTLLPEVEIVFFGTDELEPRPTFPMTNRGKL
ncbi:MAG: glycosyltransferase, partial [Chthoniobacterales bacterium]